jgi:hypothetical protein
MFLGGIITIYFSWFGLVIAVVGAFVAFTTTSTSVDSNNKKIRFSNNLFGIIPAGKWVDIKPDMKLGLEKHHRGFMGYIRGTQPVSIHYKDIRIYLYNSDNKQIMPVIKCNYLQSSVRELNILSTQLGLDVIRITA